MQNLNKAYSPRHFSGSPPSANIPVMEEPTPQSILAPEPIIEPLRWIGAYKLLKAALSLIGALLVLRLMHRNLPDVALRWMTRLHVEPKSFLGRLILHRILLIKGRSLAVAAGALFAYVPLAVAEGVGLILRKVWAEWLAVVTTAAMIPLECLEVYRRTTWLRVAILVANGLVLIYLVVRIRRDRTPHGQLLPIPLTIPSPPAADPSQNTIPQPPSPRSDAPG